MAQPPTANLTRAETRARGAAVDLLGVDVTLDLSTAPDPDATTFTSTTTTRFRSTRKDTWLDLVAPEVHAVVVNGRHVDPSDVFDGARIRLADLATDPDDVNEVEVVAACAFSTSGEGMHRFVDPVDDATYLYTQYEPADARRVFATFEQPDLKAPVTFHVVAPSDWVVRANTVGTPTAVTPATVRWDFASTPPISTYITCVVAGPWHVVTDHWSGTATDGTAVEVPLALLCRASIADALDPDEVFEVTRQGLTFFHTVFDIPYPFGTYDQAFVPEYNLGAMENPGLVTLTEAYVFQSVVTDAERATRATTILHEMAHMWFGDLVTMQWWDDLWLKESFADYMGALATAEATRFTDAWTAFANRRKAGAYRADQLPTTHPVVADIQDLEAAKLNFDGITYAKGASALKQLVAWVGRDAFFAGVNRYFADHAWSTTTLDDFLAALEAASGRDLRAWSRAWLETAGVARLHVELEVGPPDPVHVVPADPAAAHPDPVPNAGQLVTEARIVQQGTDPTTGQPVVRPHRVAVGTWDMVDGRLVRSGRTTLDLVASSAALSDLAGRPRPALVLPNDDDLTYAKTVLDTTSLEAVRQALSTIPDPLPRALVWSALWNATRDAVLPAADFLAVLVRHGPAEEHPGVLATLHGQARRALASYLPASDRTTYIERLWRASVAATRTAVPGSDRQLAWLRLAISLGGDHGAWLRGLLDGVDVPPGVVVDTRLRWATMIELAARDEVDPDAVDRELGREDSARTRRWRATARAARPSDEAKDWAWHEVADGDHHPNAMVDAIFAGWGRAGQRDLTARFETPYLAHLETWWAERSIEMARRLVRGLFPPARDAIPGGTAATHPTVMAVDGWLAAHPAAPAALRRLVVEERDQLVRSLTAQATSSRADHRTTDGPGARQP